MLLLLLAFVDSTFLSMMRLQHPAKLFVVSSEMLALRLRSDLELIVRALSLEHAICQQLTALLRCLKLFLEKTGLVVGVG